MPNPLPHIRKNQKLDNPNGSHTNPNILQVWSTVLKQNYFENKSKSQSSFNLFETLSLLNNIPDNIKNKIKQK